MINRRCAITLVITMLALVWGPLPALAAQKTRTTTVHAIGISRIQQDNRSASQQAAVNDSLTTAVTMVLNDLIPPQTAVGNFQTISESVLSRTDQFVVDYKMLTESIVGQDHRVMVNVTVSVARLTRALNSAGIPVSEKQYPRILYCIAEQWADGMGYRYWWADPPMTVTAPAAAPLADVFTRQGYPKINPDGRNVGTIPPELTVQDAVMLGRQYGADVVIAGRAIAAESPNTMGGALRSFSATVTAQAFSVASGEEMARTQRVFVSTAETPTAGSRDAIAQAAGLAGEDLTKQVARAWFAEGAGASEVSVYVEGISGNVASFVRFRGALSNMTGVDRVQRREMQQDVAVLVVQYQGNVKALAEAMMRHRFDTFGINIYEARDNQIRLQLVPRDAQ